MNAVVSDQAQNNVAEFKAPGPGERLKAARLSLDLDIAKLAEKIHLTRDMVDCIERDDYSEMPARVFVRGYVNNYARTVDLPAESVLRQFDELWPEEDDLVKVSTPRPRLPADVKPSNSIVRLVTWLLLFGGIALFLVWWQGYLDDFINKLEAPTVQESSSGVLQQEVSGQSELESTNSENIALVLPPSETKVVPDEVEPVVGSAALVLPKVVEIKENNAAITAEVVVEESVSPEAVVVEKDPLVETAVVIEKEKSVELESKPVALEVVPAPPVIKQTSLIAEQPPVPVEKGVYVTFKATSWVDIRDSTRKFKIFGEVKKGARKKLGGKAPYKIVIGNAGGVAISIDGKPYNMTPHIKGNVARFTFKP